MGKDGRLFVFKKCHDNTNNNSNMESRRKAIVLDIGSTVK
jgi:hypothetical protein